MVSQGEKRVIRFRKKKNKVYVIITLLMCLFLPCFCRARVGIDSCYCACSSKRRKTSLLRIMKYFSGGYSWQWSVSMWKKKNLLMFRVSSCGASVIVNTSKVPHEICRLRIFALMDWNYFVFERTNSCSLLKFNFSLLFRDINYALLWKY